MPTRFAALMIALLSLVFVAIPSGAAQSLRGTTLQIAHSVIVPGELQTLTVTARDLSGKPLVSARGAALVRYAGRTRHFYLAPSDASGITAVSFHAPVVAVGTRATINVTLSNGALKVSARGSFTIGKGTVVPPAKISPLDIVAQALPVQVNAPQPEWIVIYARTKAGTYRPNVPVEATVLFAQGAVHLTGVTDANGVATLRVDTTTVRTDQIVPVSVAVHDGNSLGTATAQFSLHWAPPTPIPTSTDTPVPTATWTPTPTATSTPVPTVAPSATPTATPSPTSTPTLVPTPTATATATNTPAPTSTPTPTPQCPGSGTEAGCMQMMLDTINTERDSYATQYGLQLGPLRLSMLQSYGTSTCVGSVGHSTAMAQSGNIWHVDPNNPGSPASFPNNICTRYYAAGENVGKWSINQSEADALKQIHLLMMQEQHDPAYCAQVTNHACNLLSNKFSQVGIGIVQEAGQVWLTEDFIG